MQVKAQAKFIRISPQKTRLIVNLVRGLPVEAARRQLMLSHAAAATPVLKCLDSALANAKHNFDLDTKDFVVTGAWSDEGPKLYRYRPRARGSAFPIRKRMSHITIVVGPKDEPKTAEVKATKPVKEAKAPKAAKKVIAKT